MRRASGAGLDAPVPQIGTTTSPGGIRTTTLPGCIRTTTLPGGIQNYPCLAVPHSAPTHPWPLVDLPAVLALISPPPTRARCCADTAAHCATWHGPPMTVCCCRAVATPCSSYGRRTRPLVSAPSPGTSAASPRVPGCRLATVSSLPGWISRSSCGTSTGGRCGHGKGSASRTWRCVREPHALLRPPFLQGHGNPSTRSTATHLAHHLQPNRLRRA